MTVLLEETVKIDRTKGLQLLTKHKVITQRDFEYLLKETDQKSFMRCLQRATLRELDKRRAQKLIEDTNPKIENETPTIWKGVSGSV